MADRAPRGWIREHINQPVVYLAVYVVVLKLGTRGVGLKFLVESYAHHLLGPRAKGPGVP